MNLVRADLHIHTCLSPCADLEMSPENIVKKAIEKNLDMIAITDHNSVANFLAIEKLAENQLTVLPGMEITTSEEVHILGIFPDFERAETMQKIVYENLHGKNEPAVFGEQIIVDADGYVDYCDRFLLGATTMTTDEIVYEIHENDGLAIAAHIDREAFGILGHLGFIPENVQFDALEISQFMTVESARKQFPKFSILTNSDAHRLADFGNRWSKLKMETADFDSLKQALDVN